MKVYKKMVWLIVLHYSDVMTLTEVLIMVHVCFVYL